MPSSLCPVLALRRPEKSKHRFRYVNLLQVRKRLLFIDLFIRLFAIRDVTVLFLSLTAEINVPVVLGLLLGHWSICTHFCVV